MHRKSGKVFVAVWSKCYQGLRELPHTGQNLGRIRVFEHGRQIWWGMCYQGIKVTKVQSSNYKCLSNVISMLNQHCSDVASMSCQCCIIVELTLLQCCINVISMLHHCSTDIAPVLHQCHCNVANMLWQCQSNHLVMT